MKTINLTNSVKTPRDWQTECTSKALKWLTETKEDNRFLMNAAPGSGKTICASWIADNLFDKGEIEKVIVIAPRSEVVDQWAQEYKQITRRNMLRITGSVSETEELDSDLCSTWSAINGLSEPYQMICKSKKTLVICDESHHASIKAAWGIGAIKAFEEAKYVLLLTGTPYRTDDEETAFLELNDENQISHPIDGSYEITYGQAVDEGYCRPITFHRHDGNLKVVDKQGGLVANVSRNETVVSNEYSLFKSLQKSLNFYQTALTIPLKPDGKTREYENSYHKTMLEAGIAKLEDIRNRAPNAGGLVIAPKVEIAEYMAELLEMMTGEKPVLVHHDNKGSDRKIKDFRDSKKKWIVSVKMISEGVDIPRLRTLVYLPSDQTQLFFRQAMGRVVRNLSVEDDSRAYVVMPAHKKLEEYADLVENEMSPGKRKEKKEKKNKICPSCNTESSLSQKICECGHEFPEKQYIYKRCINEECGVDNEINADECISCGTSFRQEFIISLQSAERMGVITRGSRISEENARLSEQMYSGVRRDVLESGNENMMKIFKLVTDEMLFDFLAIGMKNVPKEQYNKIHNNNS